MGGERVRQREGGKRFRGSLREQFVEHFETDRVAADLGLFVEDDLVR